MTKVVNLRTVRKQRLRDVGRAKGGVRAAAAGEGLEAAALRRAEAERAARSLDAHLRDRSTE